MVSKLVILGVVLLLVIVPIIGLFLYMFMGSEKKLTKYVKLVRKGNGITLGVVELEVYDSDGNNVAKSAKATAISSWSDITKAKNINDGIVHGKYEGKDGVLAETKHENNPWFMLELTKPVVVNKVRVFVRTDIDTSHNNTEIVLLDEKKNEIVRKSYSFSNKKGSSSNYNEITF